MEGGNGVVVEKKSSQVGGDKRTGREVTGMRGSGDVGLKRGDGKMG